MKTPENDLFLNINSFNTHIICGSNENVFRSLKNSFCKKYYLMKHHYKLSRYHF